MPQHISRRDFLALAGITATAVGAGVSAGGRASAAGASPFAGIASHRASGVASPAALPTTDRDARVLLLLELAGGNDGLSMAPPVDAARLTEYRGTDFDESALLRPGADIVLHPRLTRLQHRPLTLVDGLGTAAPDFSHFEMLRRWWAGDPDGTAGQATGFLGRLCDALDVGAPVTGLSIGSGSPPALLTERAGTLSLPDPGWLWWMDESDDDEQRYAFRSALTAMAGPDSDDGETLAAARRGVGGAMSAGALLATIGETTGYPDGDLAGKLALAAQVIDADLGVRVVQVTMNGDFDTHEGHFWRHGELIGELDGALDAFLGDLADRGLDDRVLVATMSEFGRRPELNGSGGLDHGSASVALLAGPVPAGRVGEPVDLDALDTDGNFVATTLMESYYAALAESWLGVDAAAVLPEPATPIAVDLDTATLVG